MLESNIAISVTEGRTIRDLFFNGLLDLLMDAGHSITVYTEAAEVRDFIALWQRPGITFEHLYPCDSNKVRNRSLRVRRQLARTKSQQALRLWQRVEERRAYPPHPEYLAKMRRDGTTLLLITHAHLPTEGRLVSSAHHLGIPTLGIVRSWDNVYKGIHSRPERLAVWNEINRQEVVDIEGYERDCVSVVGPSQFDPYFDPEGVWPREKVAAHLDLDPARPILTYASLGQFFAALDETCWMEALVDLIDDGLIPGRPQLVCRLHPWSKVEYFERFASHPDIRLSYVNRYWPGLGWYMTRDDVVTMGNVLRHSDVVITPGSTITLEAAIFDRPTIVPTFHPYQAQRACEYFSTWVMGKHFGRIANLGLVPVIDKREDFLPCIIKSLEEPGVYRVQRQRLVDEYVHFTDGRSTERTVALAHKLATR